MSTKSNYMFHIHRDNLIRLLLSLAGIIVKSSKMPRNFQGEFKGIRLPAGNAVSVANARGEFNENNETWSKFVKRTYGNPDIMIDGVWDVKVVPSTGTSHCKVSKHRIFVTCPSCKKEIPSGRLHQHLHSNTKCKVS